MLSTWLAHHITVWFGNRPTPKNSPSCRNPYPSEVRISITGFDSSIPPKQCIFIHIASSTFFDGTLLIPPIIVTQFFEARLTKYPLCQQDRGWRVTNLRKEGKEGRKRGKRTKTDALDSSINHSSIESFCSFDHEPWDWMIAQSNKVYCHQNKRLNYSNKAAKYGIKHSTALSVAPPKN